MNDQNQNRSTDTSTTSGRQPQEGTGLSNNYILWCKENKNKILLKNDKSNIKLMEEMLKELDESEKKRYEKEHMRSYTTSYKSFCLDAFYAFYIHRKKEIALQSSKIGYKILNRLGEDWKQLTENEKKPFYEKAKLRKGKRILLYSNECHPHKKPKIAANPKKSATTNETNFRSPPHDDTALVATQFKENDSDNHPNMVGIPNVAQFLSHDTGGHPPSFDANESTINFQLNPVATSSLTYAFPGLNQRYSYYPQPDDHNILNQDMLNCCDKFKNCNPSESQQIQQENFSPAAFCPIQTVPMDLSFTINQDMLNCCEKFRNCNPSESQKIQQQEDFSFPVQTEPLDLSCKKF